MRDEGDRKVSGQRGLTEPRNTQKMAKIGPDTLPVRPTCPTRIPLAAQDQRIQAVKMLREATGLSLLDAKNAVDAIAAGSVLPTPGKPRADLAYRARSLAGAAGRTTPSASSPPRPA